MPRHQTLLKAIAKETVDLEHEYSQTWDPAVEVRSEGTVDLSSLTPNMVSLPIENELGKIRLSLPTHTLPYGWYFCSWHASNSRCACSPRPDIDSRTTSRLRSLVIDTWRLSNQSIPANILGFRLSSLPSCANMPTPLPTFAAAVVEEYTVTPSPAIQA